MSDVDILFDHQRVVSAAFHDQPDICKCGVKIWPSPAHYCTSESVLVRRDFAFASHQIDALRARR